MKLSKLYSNRPDIFGPINFATGLNVILAEIRLPENRDRDTHNLGKTTLGRLLDFCLLSNRDAKFFLFKHEKTFQDFVFFLEVELSGTSYVTIRRSVESHSKISFKKHEQEDNNYSAEPVENWDHSNVPFQKARLLLDGLLDWRALKPWSFRKGLGYLLRSQDDFRDVFQLKKFASAHSDWKPFLSHLLGFDAELLVKHYEKEDQLSEAESVEKNIRDEIGGSVEDLSKIDGILLCKKR